MTSRAHTLYSKLVPTLVVLHAKLKVVHKLELYVATNNGISTKQFEK